MATPKAKDLYGSVPDKCPVALLLIDVINDFNFPEAEVLLRYAVPMSQNLKALASRARKASVPVIYINDNFGKWRSDFKRIVSHCLEDNVRGRAIAELLQPNDEDYFVLKPKHSGFFSTSLDLVLEYLGTRTVVLTGFAGNNCVLFTANDAYMRDYKLIIPADCIASENQVDNDNALKQMQKVLKADVRPSVEIDFAHSKTHDQRRAVRS